MKEPAKPWVKAVGAEPGRDVQKAMDSADLHICELAYDNRVLLALFLLLLASQNGVTFSVVLFSSEVFLTLTSKA